MDLIKYKIYSNNFRYIMIQYFKLIYLFKIIRKNISIYREGGKIEIYWILIQNKKIKYLN